MEEQSAEVCGEVSMFETMEQGDPRSTGRCLVSLLVSLFVHASIIGVIVVLPLVFFNVLHADEFVIFLIQPPQKLPDPPALPAPPVRIGASGIAVVSERFDPVPRTIPLGIPAPDEGDMPPVFGGVVDDIGLPGQVASSGAGISDIIDSVRVIEVQKPKAPVPRAPVRVSSGVQASRLLREVVPAYPAIAVQARASGPVMLEAEIDEEGNVTDLKVISGHPLLVEAAVEAVKQWKYSPTILNGEPQRILASITVVFRLER
jgi:protein TonB